MPRAAAVYPAYMRRHCWVPCPPLSPPLIPLPVLQVLRMSEALRWSPVASDAAGWLEATQQLKTVVNTNLQPPLSEPYGEHVMPAVPSSLCALQQWTRCTRRPCCLLACAWLRHTSTAGCQRRSRTPAAPLNCCSFADGHLQIPRVLLSCPQLV